MLIHGLFFLLNLDALGWGLHHDLLRNAVGMVPSRWWLPSVHVCGSGEDAG